MRRIYIIECKCGHQQQVYVNVWKGGYTFADKCDNCGKRIAQNNTKLIAVG